MATHSEPFHGGITYVSAVELRPASGCSADAPGQAMRSVEAALRKPKPDTTTVVPPRTLPVVAEAATTVAANVKRQAGNRAQLAGPGATGLPPGAKSTAAPDCVRLMV